MVVIASAIFGFVQLVTSIYFQDIFLKPIVRYILIVLWFCFIALWIFIYKRDTAEEKRKAIEEIKDIYDDTLDKMSKEFGFKMNERVCEGKINLDGSAIFIEKIKLEVLEGAVSSVDHFAFAWGDTVLKDFKVTISGVAEGSTISSRTIVQESQNVIILLEFSPALQRKANYEIREEMGKGIYAMTREEILDQIKENKWIMDEPYEVWTPLVVYPTDKLISRVILPKDYQIGGEELWDVTVGFRNRDTGEYKRLKNENCFSTKKEGDMQILELTISNPKIGHRYLIKWKPPFKKDYEKLLQKL